MKIIKTIFNYFKNWYRNYKYRNLTKTLQKAATNKRKERLKLRYEITKFITKFAKLDKDNKSKYIPLDFATKELIRHNVENEFGQKMSKLNVKLNSKLQVV